MFCFFLSLFHPALAHALHICSMDVHMHKSSHQTNSEASSLADEPDHDRSCEDQRSYDAVLTCELREGAAIARKHHLLSLLVATAKQQRTSANAAAATAARASHGYVVATLPSAAAAACTQPLRVHRCCIQGVCMSVGHGTPSLALALLLHLPHS
jgi:hypothetical protein